MKAVILAGGQGSRLREETEFRPKPLVQVGNKPILLHIMEGFARQGIREFVILAGFKGEMIRQYFLNFRAMTSDFHLNLRAPESIRLLNHGIDVPDWDVTVIDTGLKTETAGRLLAARKYLDDSRFFLTYGDGLANVNLQELIAVNDRTGSAVTVTVSKAKSRFGHVAVEPNGIVTSFEEKPTVPDYVNIGFFVARPTIFQFIDRDEPLESRPLADLARSGELSAHVHNGFFQSMDTLRDAQLLNSIFDLGAPFPWDTQGDKGF